MRKSQAAIGGGVAAHRVVHSEDPPPPSEGHFDHSQFSGWLKERHSVPAVFPEPLSKANVGPSGFLEVLPEHLDEGVDFCHLCPD